MGLEWAGLGPTLWQCEADPYCQRVLRRHWPEARIYDDVRSCHPSHVLDRSVRTFYDGPMAGKLRKLTTEQAAEAVRMYQAGLSLSPIADYFSVSRQAMWDLIRRRTAMRPQRRSGRENHFYRGGSTEDDHAQNLVEVALRQGILIRKGGCEACGDSGTFKDGRTKIQAHHDDYNYPLSVRWLCQKCHHEWHRKHRARRKEVLCELSPVDVICGGFP